MPIKAEKIWSSASIAVRIGLFCSAICLAEFARASLISDADLKIALESADLEAVVTVVRRTSSPDPVRARLTQATVTVEKILRTNDRTADVTAGAAITVELIGGEDERTGVFFSGYPHALVGSTYRATLRLRADGSYEPVALDQGWQANSATRNYSRNRTDGSNGDGTGPFLYWEQRGAPIPYFISLSSFGTHSDYAPAIDLSFGAWSSPSDVSLDFIAMGCADVTRNENDGLNTVILIHENWPFDASAIAITRNFYVSGEGPFAGRILDSDILLNAQNHRFTTTGEMGAHDVQNIVTHEAGHFIGMGHEYGTIDTEATMYAVASPNELKKRTLDADDLAGLRSAYLGIAAKNPPTSSLNSCSLDAGRIGCMSVSSGNSGRGQLAVLVLWILGTLSAMYVRRKFNRSNVMP